MTYRSKFDSYPFLVAVRPAWFAEAIRLVESKIPHLTDSTPIFMRQTSPEIGSFLFTLIVQSTDPESDPSGEGANQLWQVSVDGLLFRAPDEILLDKRAVRFCCPGPTESPGYISAAREALSGLAKFVNKNAPELNLVLS